ncbi:MAG: dTDP-glucose 4,6-dehydratase [Candidatus Omnitrophota bacterium]
MNYEQRTILVTGGAGFIGSEFVRQISLRSYEVVVVDKITYAGDSKRLKDTEGRYKFYKVDICNKAGIDEIFKKENPQIVVHFAAATHVDRSIIDASSFMHTNVKGTQNLLDVSREHKIRKFIHISTDEVYGEIKKGEFTEESPLKPNSPYAASKAAADLLIRAYIRTYNFPAIIIRPCNNYGPWQYPEKFIPVIIYKALKNEKIPVYGKGKNIREWLYVSDCARGILKVMEKGKIGEVYNLGSSREEANFNLVKKILKVLAKPESLIKFVSDRPGHDWRYSLDSSKIIRLGWKPNTDFEAGIEETVSWYMKNLPWLQSKVKHLRNYWKKIYKK